MRQKRLLSGTIEQQLAQMDGILTQFKRREVKHIIGVIPPIPLFAYSDKPGPGGVIFRFLSPLNGKVKRIAAAVESMPKSGITVSILSESEIGAVSKFLSVKKVSGIYQSDIDIIAGDKITARVENIDATEESPRGIWISVLIQPMRTELESEKFLLDALEKEEINDSKEERKEVEDSSLSRKEEG